MFSKFKIALNKLPFKKRYIVGGYLAFELIGLAIAGTAGAQILEQIKFDPPQSVASAKLPSEAGLTRLVISSNAPFTILASEAIGKFDINVKREGLINTTPFGRNAQMPGPASACAHNPSLSEAIIYRADKKTSLARGPILSQSIMVEIKYDAALSPKFSVKTEDNSVALMPAAVCELEVDTSES